MIVSLLTKEQTRWISEELCWWINYLDTGVYFFLSSCWQCFFFYESSFIVQSSETEIVVMQWATTVVRMFSASFHIHLLKILLSQMKNWKRLAFVTIKLRRLWETILRYIINQSSLFWILINETTRKLIILFSLISVMLFLRYFANTVNSRYLEYSVSRSLA